MNDTNTDSDGPTWIQTATGGDKPRTAGGTPTTDLFMYHVDKRPLGGVLSSRGEKPHAT